MQLWLRMGSKARPVIIWGDWTIDGQGGACIRVILVKTLCRADDDVVVVEDVVSDEE